MAIESSSSSSAASSSPSTDSSTSSGAISNNAGSLAGPHISLSAPNVSHFIKLNDSNYIIWLCQMAPFLNGYGFMKYVDGSFPAPKLNEGNDSTSISSDYLSWFQTDQLIVSYITSTLTEQILSLVVGKKTSKSVWECFKNHFAQQSVANAANLRFQLLSISKGTKNVSEYLQHAKSLSDALASIGEPVSNIDIVTSILRGLGPDYSMIVTAILNFPPFPQYEDLRARLLSFETQIAHSASVMSTQTTPPVPTALHAANNGSPATQNPSEGNQRNNANQNGNQFSSRNTNTRWNRNRGRNNNRGANNNWHNGNGNNGNWNRGNPSNWNRNNSTGVLGAPPLSCQICSNVGHSASSCPQRIPPQLQTAFAGFQWGPQSDPSWYLDSGATHHMTESADAMPYRTPYPGNDSIFLGNGTSLNISHTGNIPLKLGTCTFHLKNAYHVPAMSTNLLSVAKFTKDNNVNVTFSPSSYSIHDSKSGALLFQGQCKDGLYPISSSTTSPRALIASSSQLWHNRLGHPNSKVLSFLGSNKMLSPDFKLQLFL
ncbi:hypothetical protein ACHQM5_003176 [Ranunculus cassubicifolius]